MHFTIDSENILTVHETAPAAELDTIAISSEKELKRATADWPIPRLVEVWNGFAGVVPLDDLKPVKKFTDRATGLKRIWAAMLRLADHNRPANNSGYGEKAIAKQRDGRTSHPAAETASAGPRISHNAPVKAKSTKEASGGGDAPEGKRRAGTHAALVIELLGRADGASIDEIAEITGWQRHTIRGFVSTLAKKGYAVTSTRRQDGARVYAITK